MTEQNQEELLNALTQKINLQNSLITKLTHLLLSQDESLLPDACLCECYKDDQAE